jgi:hypothetical protein
LVVTAILLSGILTFEIGKCLLNRASIPERMIGALWLCGWSSSDLRLISSCLVRLNSSAIVHANGTVRRFGQCYFWEAWKGHGSGMRRMALRTVARWQARRRAEARLAWWEKLGACLLQDNLETIMSVKPSSRLRWHPRRLLFRTKESVEARAGIEPAVKV